jgi:hypothetical protein
MGGKVTHAKQKKGQLKMQAGGEAILETNVPSPAGCSVMLLFVAIVKLPRGMHHMHKHQLNCTSATMRLLLLISHQTLLLRAAFV